MANLTQIEKYLTAQKLPYKIVDLGDKIYTVEGVVESGVNRDEIVKTLIIRFHSNSSPGLERGYAALAVRGKDRVDFKKVRKLFGPSTSLRVKCELAKPDEVLRVCKVPVGAVCPILLNIPVYSERQNSDVRSGYQTNFERRSENHDRKAVGIYFDRRVMDLAHVNMGSGDLTKGLEMNLADLLKAVREFQVEDLIKS